MKIEVENAQQNEQVDWTKNPQLVVSNMSTPEVYIFTHETGEDKFNGIRISDFIDNPYLIKENFKPFHGKITLSND